jgi:hypothetical protein
MAQPPMQQHHHQPQHPPHQAPHPQHGPPPGHAMPPPAGGKSKTGLYIGLGVGALAVAGGVIAIVLLTKKSGPSGGGSSREDVVRQTIAALTRGDADTLLKLTGIENSDRFIKCDKKQDPEDRKKSIERLRERYQEAADAAKGAKVEIVEIGKDDDPEVTKKGTTVEQGEGECETTMEVIEHRFEIALKVTPKDGKAAKQETKMSVMSVGGGWFLDKPPEIKIAGSCDKAIIAAMDRTEADTIKSAGQKIPDKAMKAVLKDMRAVALTRCTEDSWDDDVLECLNKEATTTDLMDACFKRLSTTQQEKFEAGIAEVVKKHQALNGTDVPKPDSSGFGPVCSEYKRLVSTIVCDSISEDTRASLLRNFETIMSTTTDRAEQEADCARYTTGLRSLCPS